MPVVETGIIQIQLENFYQVIVPVYFLHADNSVDRVL